MTEHGESSLDQNIDAVRENQTIERRGEQALLVVAHAHPLVQLAAAHEVLDVGAAQQCGHHVPGRLLDERPIERCCKPNGLGGTVRQSRGSRVTRGVD